MPTVQIYEKDKDVKLFDNHLTITLESRGYKYYAGFSKGSVTKIFKRLGYRRTGNWEQTDWGYQATFKRIYYMLL